MNNSAIAGAAVKRHKTHHRHHDDHQSIIPGLPDHIARICLNLVDPFTLFSVCHSWRKLIYSPSFPPFLSVYALLLPSKSSKYETKNSADFSDSVEFACFDPISSKWQLLPPVPPEPPLRLLVKHPSFISRNLPIQSVSVSGNLILLAATADQFLPAISRPLIFNPAKQKWSYGPRFAAPRRWCAAGASGNAVFVASGVGSQYNSEVARSVVKWDLDERNRNGPHNCYCNHTFTRCICCTNRWKWEEMSGLKDGKFSREAIEAIGWKGKLCMVNVKGDAAKQGIIYNVGKDTWQEMPEGMLVGWRGPAAAMAEETLYTVDESKGSLRKYDEVRDIWVEIVESEMFKGAEHVAAAGGRVCVVGSGGKGIVVVDVVAKPPSLVVVETPVGFHVLNIHILPRMSQLAEYSESSEQY